MRAEAMRLLSAAIAVLATAAGVSAQTPDPRVGLKAGFKDAGAAANNVELVGSAERPASFVNEKNLGDILVANSDMAFQGDNLFMGSFHGFQIWDIANPKQPRLRTAFVCPGGQGDMSVYGNLLFMSVEMPNGKVDCANAGMAAFQDSVSASRFIGVRIFDITDMAKPKQIAAIQTCRGSHTHTLVTDAKDKDNVYIYVQGTSGVRSPSEMAGCSGLPPEKDPNTAYFRIEVIKVPLAAPHTARIVNAPRIFARADTIAGLWKGGAHGEGTQSTATTNQCHDITVFPEIGMAGGACSGNGILLDISDPANPVRIAEVMDPNFAYWHSATFNNDGTKVIFTDEWGGGMAARCLATDKKEWGADALFELKDRKLALKGYYKLPAPQSAQENCVAHNGSLIPVPGRDIMAQAWYQGGLSIFDFTDTAHPVEIASFDRGAYSDKDLLLGGMWSTYWYNGRIYASEIGRGLDIFELKPSEFLSQNEIDAAKLVQVGALNPQTQTRTVWPASFVVGRAYVDQLRRAGSNVDALAADLQRAESATGAARSAALAQAAASLSKLNSASRSAMLLADLLKDLAR
jgi:hypothetical protein